MSIAKTIAAFVGRRLGKHGVPLSLLQSAGIGGLIFLVAHIIMRQVDASFEMLCIPPPDPGHYDSMRDSVLCDPQAWTWGGLVDVMALGALGLGLLVVVPALVTVAVAGERKQGTLEQLRTAPLSPLALVMGFVVGTPARVYLWLSVPLVLHVGYGFVGGISLWAALTSLLPLVIGSFALSLLGVLFALGSRRPSGGALPGLVMAGSVGALGLFGLAIVHNVERQPMAWSFLHPAAATQAVLLGEESVWRHLFVRYWRLERLWAPEMTSVMYMQGFLSTVFFGALALLLLRATTRRLQRPHLPVLGKPMALGLFALVAIGVIAPVLQFDYPYRGYDVARYALGYGFVLLPLVALLLVLVTPSRELWTAGLGRRLGLFADARGSMSVAVGTIVTFGGMVLVQHHGFDFYRRMHESIAVVWGLALVLTLPVLWQYHITRKERGGGYLFLLGAYLLIEVIGIALCGMGDGTRPDSHPIATVFTRAAAAIAIGLPIVVGLLQRRETRQALATPALHG